MDTPNIYKAPTIKITILNFCAVFFVSRINTWHADIVAAISETKVIQYELHWKYFGRTKFCKEKKRLKTVGPNKIIATKHIIETG